MKCPYCEQKIEDDALSCQFCGKIIASPKKLPQGSEQEEAVWYSLVDNQIIYQKNIPTPQEAIELHKCPITGTSNLDTTIKLSKWLILIIATEYKHVDVPVSSEGKELYFKNLSTLWQFFDTVGGVLMQIPFIGGYLLLMLLTVCIAGVPIFAILDKVLERKILSRGIIYLSNSGAVERRS
jgi:hypothetical protein